MIPGVSLLDPQTFINAGYVVIALVIFAECGLLIGFFLPGDSLLFTAGFLASPASPAMQLATDTAHASVDIWTLSIICGVAAATGPLVGYWYGAWAGPRLFNREDTIWFHKQNLVRAHEFYERHGGKALILARFMPVVRTFAPVVAGMARMEYSRFVLYTVVGALVWGVGMSWLGYFLGSLIPGKYLEYVVVAIILVSIAPPVIHVLRERNKSRASLTRV
jgi:membrane-associated protein